MHTFSFLLMLLQFTQFHYVCSTYICKKKKKGFHLELNSGFLVPSMIYMDDGKLAYEHNPIKALMGMESSACDLWTSRKLKNTDAVISFP